MRRASLVGAFVVLAACHASTKPTPDTHAYQIMQQCAVLALNGLGFDTTPRVKTTGPGWVVGTKVALDSTFDWLQLSIETDTTQRTMWVTAEPHTQLATPGYVKVPRMTATSIRARNAAESVEARCGTPVPMATLAGASATP